MRRRQPRQPLQVFQPPAVDLNMIHPTSRCIFIHIPRTAGNSVNRLFGIDWQNHQDLAAYARELPPDVFARYVKFAIVRNPWERLLSDYNYQRRKSRPKSSKLFLFDETGRRRSFRQWIEAALADPFRHAPETWGGRVSPGMHRWSPQVDWISLDGKIAVDHVLRLERLQTEFFGLQRRLNLPPHALPRRNHKFHLHYSHYYDAATQRRVGEFYARDIAAFGYRFEPAPSLSRWIFSWIKPQPSRQEKITLAEKALVS